MRNIEEFKSTPEKYLSSRRSVLNDRRLSVDQKRDILRRWSTKTLQLRRAIEANTARDGGAEAELPRKLAHAYSALSDGNQSP